MKRFTDNWIKSIKATGKVHEVRESDGFLLRVSPVGTKTFYYIYTDTGKRQRIKIGEYGVMSLAAARSKATDLFLANKRGENLKQEEVGTVKGLAEKYLAEHAKPNNADRTYSEVQRMLERDILPVIGNCGLDTISRRDVHSLVQKIQARPAPAVAMKVLKIIRRMFNYGIESGVTETNPAYMIRLPPGREKTRVLTDKESATLLYAKIDAKTADTTMRCIKLILVTAQRPGECLDMLHEEIDGDWWTIPKQKTKNKKLAHATDHRVFLTPLAKELIGSGSGPVFPSPAHVSALGAALRRLRTRLAIEPFSPHDLRRTAATHMAEMGFSQEIVDKVLAHTSGKIARTYNRYAYDKEKKEALLAWGEKLKKMKP